MNTAEQPPIPSKVFFETLDARGTAHVTGRASNGYGICSPYTPENTFIGISQDDLKEASVIYLQKLDINVRWTRNGFKDGRGCDYHIYKASLAPFDGGEAYVPDDTKRADPHSTNVGVVIGEGVSVNGGRAYYIPTWTYNTKTGEWSFFKN